MSSGLSKDERKARRSIEPAFNQAFRVRTKSIGWGYLKPTAFKQLGEWFVAFHPVIWSDERRAQLSANIKPFAIDELMSRIMGFGSLEGSPLSLRARGPYCLVRPIRTASIESDGNIDAMLLASSSFMDEAVSFLDVLSLDDFVEFSRDDVPAGKISVNAVAALILAGRTDEALEASEAAIAAKQSDGPARMTEDGHILSFFDLAKRWIKNSLG